MDSFRWRSKGVASYILLQYRRRRKSDSGGAFFMPGIGAEAPSVAMKGGYDHYPSVTFRGRGGMVYTRDLKSLGFGLAGSSPAARTKLEAGQ